MDDIGYQIVIANPTAKCPFCTVRVEVMEKKDGTLKAQNPCRHFHSAEPKFKAIWCKFLKAPLRD